MTFGLIELMVKKKRPREHIIADLSVNHVERWVFLCGYSVERIEHELQEILNRSKFDIIKTENKTNQP